MKNKFRKSLFLLLFVYMSSVSSVFAVPPANDELANASNIIATPFTAIVLASDSDEATNDTNEVSCSSDFYNGTWWYSITLSESGVLTADAMSLNPALVVPEDIDNDTAVNVAIYSGTSHPLNELACEGSFFYIPVDPDDKEGDSVDLSQSIINPTVSALLPAGTYYILVGNSTNSGTEGDIQVRVDFAPAPILAPATASIPVNSPLALMLLILGLLMAAFIKQRKNTSRKKSI